VNLTSGRSINVRSKPGCLIGFALFWTAFSSIFLVIGVTQEELPFTIVGGLFVLIGIGLLFFSLLTMYTRYRVGKPEIQLSDQTLRVGQPLTISYFHSFKSHVRVGQILVKLIFKETATYQQGTDTRTVQHEEIIAEFEEPGGEFRSGTMIEHTFNTRIPPDGMHTLNVRRNQLQWFVKFQIEIPSLPDFVNEYELDVLPALYKG